MAAQKNDIFAQLGSTLLYGLLVWILFRVLDQFEGQSAVIIVSVILILGCLTLNYLVEKWRWLITIRGSPRPRWWARSTRR